MAKGEGFKYYLMMLRKAQKFLKDSFKKDPNNIPLPLKGMSFREIVEESIRRELK